MTVPPWGLAHYLPERSVWGWPHWDVAEAQGWSKSSRKCNRMGGQAEKGPSVSFWGQWKIQSFGTEEELKEIFGRGKMAVVATRSNYPQ